MVKRVLSVNRTGLRDWLVQRCSAIFMAGFILFLAFFMLTNSPLTFEQWSQLFSSKFMRAATLIFIFLMLWHAWVGLWTVVTDYIKCFKVRAAIYSVVIFMLASCFLYSCMILLSFNN